MSDCCNSARKDWTLRQGVTWRQGIRLREKASQDPWDLSGYTGTVTVRRGGPTGTVVAELTTAGGEVTITALTGRVEWVLQMDFPAGLYSYSANLQAPDDGDVTQPLHGTITLEADPNYTAPA